MLELRESNAAAYLSARLGGGADVWRIAPLGGGVSNTVLLAESRERRLVLKQALPKLRVKEDWPADPSRIRREWEAMQALGPVLEPGSVPGIVFTDEENLIFGMTAAPGGARTWKALLLEGETAEPVARRVAGILGGVIRTSWQSAAWESRFGDLTAFEQLRLDPYYRFTAARHPDLAARFEARIRQARRERWCVVHGDWSPKNFLVAGDSVMAIDFEVTHYGDPSFDAAFLLNHLLLKSFHRPRWAPAYARLAEVFRERLLSLLPAGAGWFEEAAVRHLGCLLLARVDGKSPAEYLGEEAVKSRIREYARRLIVDPPGTVGEVFQGVPA